MERPAARELIPHPDGESFRWIEHDYPCDIARWNYHPEVEIHLIRRSTGSFIIGDEVGAFGPGHVAIVGPEVPHDWMSDLADDEVIENRDAVIQFTPDWLQSSIQAIPELQPALAPDRSIKSRHRLLRPDRRARRRRDREASGSSAAPDGWRTSSHFLTFS